MMLNPLAWPLAAKIAGIAATAMVIAGTTTGLLVSASAEPGVTTYLCSMSGGAWLLQWKDSSGYLDGTFEQASLTGTAPQEQVNTATSDLSGQINGSGITLDPGSAGPYYGNISGPRLTFNVPQQDGTIQSVTCTSSDVPTWNKTVTALNSQADSDNQAANRAAAQQQQDQQVSQAQQSLSQDTSSLLSDSNTLNNDTTLGQAVDQMKSDYSQEQSDWATEQTTPCSDGQTSAEAGTVSGDAGTVSGDQGTLQGDITTLQSNGIAAVKTDLTNVQNDLSALQNLGATPSTGTSSAIATGNKALTSAANAISWATGQGNTINNEAQQLSNTATNYANQHSC